MIVRDKLIEVFNIEDHSKRSIFLLTKKYVGNEFPFFMITDLYNASFQKDEQCNCSFKLKNLNDELI